MREDRNTASALFSGGGASQSAADRQHGDVIVELTEAEFGDTAHQGSDEPVRRKGSDADEEGLEAVQTQPFQAGLRRTGIGDAVRV